MWFADTSKPHDATNIVVQRNEVFPILSVGIRSLGVVKLRLNSTELLQERSSLGL
jgi:hypothetical protein